MIRLMLEQPKVEVIVLGDQDGVNLLSGPVFSDHKQPRSVGGLTCVSDLGVLNVSTNSFND